MISRLTFKEKLNSPDHWNAVNVSFLILIIVLGAVVVTFGFAFLMKFADWVFRTVN